MQCSHREWARRWFFKPLQRCWATVAWRSSASRNGSRSAKQNQGAHQQRWSFISKQRSGLSRFCHGFHQQSHATTQFMAPLMRNYSNIGRIHWILVIFRMTTLDRHCFCPYLPIFSSTLRTLWRATCSRVVALMPWDRQNGEILPSWRLGCGIHHWHKNAWRVYIYIHYNTYIIIYTL